MVDKAYITYPASFGRTRQEKITQAAKKAGLFDVELIDEPTAAAMCYGAKGTLKDGDILLVYDFGGGTFDTAVIKYEDGKYESIVLAEGLAHCGGIDIDGTMSRKSTETVKNLVSIEKISFLTGIRYVKLCCRIVFFLCCRISFIVLV
jgi:molecular chaperone DnaK (HSP70)